MSKRKQRHQQFSRVYTGVYGSMSPQLLVSSELLLRQSLDQRRRQVSRTANNHFSTYAAGSIVLLIDGFEAWLNESIWHYWNTDSRDKILKLGNAPILEKYYEVPRRSAANEIAYRPHLEMAVDLRNEIAHFLPRIISEQIPMPLRHVPPGLEELYEQQLFFVPSGITENVEMTLDDLVSSYRLAYWTWETVAEAAKTYCEALSGTQTALMLYTENFELYKRNCPPSNLPQYDVIHGLPPV
jgi:hypothetical protein